jgi:N-acyl amino acid synthase of PEP-CTERM/exosortase system
MTEDPAQSRTSTEEESLKEVYVRYFETVIARSDQQLAAAHKLRYQVYCVENAFEDPADNPDGLERDLYDSRATHCLLMHRESGTVAGTARLVLPSSREPDSSFPLQSICDDPLIRNRSAFPINRMAEVSRFCVAKKFRRRHNEGAYGRYESDMDLEANRRLIPHITLGLIEGLVRMSLEQGIDYWCATMEPSLLRLLRRMGIHFDDVGPRVDYHGIRQPCFQRLDQFLKRVGIERPDVWDVLTDDGRHWMSLQERMADTKVAFA